MSWLAGWMQNCLFPEQKREHPPVSSVVFHHLHEKTEILILLRFDSPQEATHPPTFRGWSSSQRCLSLSICSRGTPSQPEWFPGSSGLERWILVVSLNPWVTSRSKTCKTQGHYTGHKHRKKHFRFQGQRLSTFSSTISKLTVLPLLLNDFYGDVVSAATDRTRTIFLVLHSQHFL